MCVCLQRPESISLGTGVKGSVSADGVSGSQTGVLWKNGMLSQLLSRLSNHPTPFKTGPSYSLNVKRFPSAHGLNTGFPAGGSV